MFSPDMENLDQIRWLTSNANFKNVAYVYAQNGSAAVYSPLVDPTISGEDRRIMLINSSNSGPAGAALTTALQQEGLTALGQQKLVYAFDGELPPSVSYVYGVDYGLGDLVEERNMDGDTTQMFVAEQIFSSDSTGERSYPTLVLYQTATTGSWSQLAGSWNSLSGTWNDL